MKEENGSEIQKQDFGYQTMLAFDFNHHAVRKIRKICVRIKNYAVHKNTATHETVELPLSC